MQVLSRMSLNNYKLVSITVTVFTINILQILVASYNSSPSGADPGFIKGGCNIRIIARENF